MPEYQKRVVAEKKELDEKLAKLTAFIGGGVWLKLPIEESVRLNKQREYMDGYSRVLGERIAAFPV